MTHGSLFSGIGGFDLAAQWMGWENVFHCEWNEFGQKVLKHYWPKSISYGDITKTDFTIHRGRIDILTGGFPCQPYSSAGKRLGKADDRHLWPEMLRAIWEIQPRWIVGENVRGLTNWNGGLVFDEVQSDLEAQGYEVTPFLLPACAVDAPHRRDRIWFVAHNANGIKFSSERRVCERPNNVTNRICKVITTNPNHNGHATAENRQSMGAGNDSDQTGKDEAEQLAGCSVSVNATPNPTRRQEQHTTTKPGGEVVGSWHVVRDVPNTTSQRHEPRNQAGTKLFSTSAQPGLHGGGGYKFHNPNAWHKFPTQSPVCSGNDGISSRLVGITFPKHRNESIKAYGDAVVPQVVYQIFKAIQQYEATTKL
jgi:DNA (cytosine-5)-methyltransferase 1